MVGRRLLSHCETALILLTASMFGNAQTPVLSLDEAVNLAIAHNRNIEQANLAEHEAGDRIEIAKTQRLPHFKFSATAGQLLTQPTITFEQGAMGSYPGIGPVPATNTQITSPRQPAAIITGEVALPLTQQYRIGLEIKSLTIGRQNAGQQVRRTRQQVVQQVREAYYAILQGQSSLEAVEETLALYREVSATTGRYVKAGTALDADLLSIRARLTQAEYDKASLEAPLATQKERLNQLLGRQVDTEFRVSAAIEASWTEPDLAEARRRALASRPEVEQARLKLEQTGLERRIKKSEYIPDISLSTNYYSLVNVSATLPSNVAIAGVQVTWEPFDWGRKKKELAAKDIAAEQAATQLKETQAQVQIEAASAQRKLQQARLMMAAARTGKESAGETLRLASVRYKLDAALLTHVLEAQSGVASANERMQKAAIFYWNARAELERAMGEDR